MKGSMLASVSSGRDNSNYLGVLAAGFLVCCVLAFPGIAVAQTPATTALPTPGENKAENASDILAHAKELYSTEGPKAALPEFEKALTLFRKNGDKKGE